MIVRKADISDLETILSLETSCFSDPWSEESFIRAFEDGLCEFAVAEDESGVFGYILFSTFFEDAEIMSVAVRSGKRHLGAGKVLVERALGRSSELGASRCFLEVRESNDAARNLYRGLGFKELRKIRNYYRLPTEDAIVMRLLFKDRRETGRFPTDDGQL